MEKASAWPWLEKHIPQGLQFDFGNLADIALRCGYPPELLATVSTTQAPYDFGKLQSPQPQGQQFALPAPIAPATQHLAIAKQPMDQSALPAQHHPHQFVGRPVGPLAIMPPPSQASARTSLSGDELEEGGALEASRLRERAAALRALSFAKPAQAAAGSANVSSLGAGAPDNAVLEALSLAEQGVQDDLRAFAHPTTGAAEWEQPEGGTATPTPSELAGALQQRETPTKEPPA